MGTSLELILSSLDMKGRVLHNKGKCKSTNGSFWSKDIAANALKRRRERKERTLMALTKRRVFPESSHRFRNGAVSKVRTLKKLVPNGKLMTLDGLFRETADYILCLEMQVKVMQNMVEVLSISKD